MIKLFIVLAALLLILKVLRSWFYHQGMMKTFIENLYVGDVFYHPDNATRKLTISYIDYISKTVHLNSNQDDSVTLTINDLFYCEYIKEK